MPLSSSVSLLTASTFPSRLLFQISFLWCKAIADHASRVPPDIMVLQASCINNRMMYVMQFVVALSHELTGMQYKLVNFTNLNLICTLNTYIIFGLNTSFFFFFKLCLCFTLCTFFLHLHKHPFLNKCKLLVLTP